jgi:hypothetical protein
MLFRKLFPLMDEQAGEGGAGGGGFAVGAEGAGSGEAAAPEFIAELAFESTSETHEEAAQRAAAEKLTQEGQGWIDPSKGKVEFSKTGDTGLDIALGFLAQHGFSHHHPAVQAAAKGDFSLLSATLAAKGIQGWEQHIALGKEAFARGQEQAKATNEKIKAQCLAATGGDEALWNDARAYLSQHADPEEKTAINAALSKGDVVSEAVAHYMVHLFRNSPGVTVNPSQQVVNTGKAVSNAGSAVAPLSPREYSAEVQKLAAKIGGSNLSGSPEYAALQRRRGMFRG